MDQAPGGRVRYPEQRQEEILALLEQQRQVEVSTLATSFGVTGETIRRDLSELQRRRLARRVHGGAIPWETGRVTAKLAARNAEHANEKRRMAKIALQELPPEGQVLLDSGSTVAHLAKELPLDCQLTIVTNSLANIEALSEHEDVQLVVLGGEVEHDTLTMVDAATVAAIQELRVDTLVLGTDGASPEGGLSTPYRNHAAVKQAMIDTARRVVLMADSSKLGSDYFVRFARWDDVDTIITDTAAPKSVVAAIEALGTTVLLA